MLSVVTFYFHLSLETQASHQYPTFFITNGIKYFFFLHVQYIQRTNYWIFFLHQQLFLFLNSTPKKKDRYDKLQKSHPKKVFISRSDILWPSSNPVFLLLHHINLNFRAEMYIRINISARKQLFYSPENTRLHVES